tara:strand:- start:76 stop:654 length:579 start_codon:yes stop_codon:yes gene_type:complete
MGDHNCSHINCKLKQMHWHCGYCKEIQNHGWNTRRSNCDLCSREITAKTKLSSLRSEIKKQLLNCEHKDEDKIIIFLKSKIDTIKRGKSFYGSNEDIEKIIENYLDKSKPLPSTRNCWGYHVNLNNSRKKKFDHTDLNYLKLIKEYNREIIHINCHFHDKDDCKALGGKWDNNKRSWYIPKGVDSTKFKKWL